MEKEYNSPLLQSELDEEQEIVVLTEGSQVISAGPGSGKTRVLTSKARRTMDEGKSVICLCFTRSASKEMASRVEGLPATTIHSYCCGVVGWEESWGYTGLLYRYLLEKEKTKFDLVLCDEFQDLNQLELEVVLEMVGKDIFAVGDPYQSIYGFQGAMGIGVANVLKGMGAKEQVLHNNYRSCPQIIRKIESIFKRDLVSASIKENNLTAILCRTNDDVFLVSRELLKAGIPHHVRLGVGRAEEGQRNKDYISKSNLRVSTIHVAKGQEFDRVIIFGWHPDLAIQEEKRTYYVACSRASKELYETDNIEEVIELVKEN